MNIIIKTVIKWENRVRCATCFNSILSQIQRGTLRFLQKVVIVLGTIYIRCPAYWTRLDLCGLHNGKIKLLYQAQQYDINGPCGTFYYKRL